MIKLYSFPICSIKWFGSTSVFGHDRERPQILYIHKHQWKSLKRKSKNINAGWVIFYMRKCKCSYRWNNNELICYKTITYPEWPCYQQTIIGTTFSNHNKNFQKNFKNSTILNRVNQPAISNNNRLPKIKDVRQTWSITTFTRTILCSLVYPENLWIYHWTNNKSKWKKTIEYSLN